MEALQEKKTILQKEYDNALYHYELKKKELEDIDKKIISYCNKQGHQWVKEIENGMYGETFSVCKKCGLFY
jgi:hypothetical protein